MANKIDNIISDYVKNSKLLVTEADLPELPEVAPVTEPEVAPVTADPEMHDMTGEAYVTAVKTMIELLSYGLHAEDDAIHRDPVAKWLREKDKIDNKTAWGIVKEIDDFLANEDLS
jgi:hypothetical protein